MALSRQISRALGGDIRLSSPGNPDAGAVRRRVHRPTAGRDGGGGSPMGGTELTVLVVDDDFRVANMHAGIVNALPGFTVTTTVTTLAAAHKADPVDLALVDVYLPDGSGIDFVRELRCDSMVLSAATDAPTIRAALAAGALSYLVKPFAPADLVGPAVGLCALPQDPRRNQSRRPGGGLGTGRTAPAHRTCAVADRRGLPHEAACAGRRFARRASRCRRPSSPRKSAFRGQPRNGICRRWPIPAKSRSSSATARRDGPNRNSSPSTSRPTALDADVQTVNCEALSFISLI